MKEIGQGSLEYLLIIGGALLMAAIVITITTGLPSGIQETPEVQTLRSICFNRTLTPPTACDSTLPGGGTSEPCVNNTCCDCIIDSGVCTLEDGCTKGHVAD